MMEKTGKIKVLFVDDDLLLGQVVSTALQAEGYEVHYQNSLAGITACAATCAPDIIFLDVEIGTENGIEEAPRLRALLPEVPLFFISSHTEGTVIRKGLETGATGFLKKPFDMEELTGYIRRYAVSTDKTCISIGNLTLDKQTQELTDSQNGKLIRCLSNMEYRLLKLLAASQGQAVGRKQIEATLWAETELPNSQSLMNCVSHLRKYLSAGSGMEIALIPKQGYVLRPEQTSTLTDC